MMFTKEEEVFLLQLLDQVNVSGVAAKTMVVVIMGKLSDSTNVPYKPAQEEGTIKPNEEDTDILDTDADAS